MKASDLYKMTPESETKNLECLKGCYYSHIPELEDVDWLGDLENEKVTIKTIKHFDFDYRRYWNLSTVWFEDSPVMIIQNAGRDGDDCNNRFITNESSYREMVTYIKSLVSDNEYATFLEDLIDADEDVPNLTEFYGNKLTGHFEKHRY